MPAADQRPCKSYSTTGSNGCGCGADQTPSPCSEAASLLQHDADLLVLRSGVRAVLGAQRMHLAALPVQVYPVRYASFAGCARSLKRRHGGAAVSSLAGA